MPERRSSSEKQRDGSVGLERKITLLNGISIIVGSIIGSGVFVSPGGVLKYAGSPAAALVVWTLSGVLCTIGALCFSELGTLLPASGGEYTYVLQAFGGLPAFTTLWVNVVLIRPAAQAVVALACAEYSLALLFPHCAPPHPAVVLLAALVMGLLTAINCYSVSWAMRIQMIFTAAKLLALLIITLMGLYTLVTENGGHLADTASAADLNSDWQGLALAFYSGLFAYGGWNYLNFVTEELKDPYRNLPLAIWIGLPLVTVVYVLVNISYLVVLPADLIVSSSAVAVDFGLRVLGPLRFLVPIFVALSTFGSLNGILFTSGRLFLAAARESHMPAVLSFIDVKARTPKPALLTSFFLSLCLLGLDIIALINCLSFALWLIIGAATAALLRLRQTHPHVHRPIKVPLVLPIIFLACCGYLVIVPLITDPRSTGFGVLFTLSALPVYYAGLYCKNNSKAQRVSRSVSLVLQKLLTVVCPNCPNKEPLLLQKQ
ncbi:Amino acid/polyamine transporter I [Trinorchestia longiramus]|nr:Amino acid/polyamine transporter I [Trinorchestia longiramus]